MSVQSQIDRITDNLDSAYDVLEQAGATMPQTRNSANLAGTAASISAVLYNKAQSLTDTQKAQARTNMGITGTGADGAKGDTGPRGTGVLKITTAPSSYTTATGGFTPTYRVSLSTVKSQSKATQVLVGDTIAYSYYLYPVGYVDSSYVYLGARTSIRGATGATGATGPAGPAGADAETIPDYVRTEAETVARIVNKHQSNDSIVFPFLADAHCGYYLDTEEQATKLAGQLLDLIGKRVPFDFVANGGDLSTGAWDTTREKTYEHYEDYTELTSDGQRGVPSVWVPGNHDDAPFQATANRATQKDVFALVGRKSRASGAMVPNGCNYGYLDLDSRRLRVICLDTDDKRSWGTVQVGNGAEAPVYLYAHNIGGAQLKWLADVALDFSDKENPADWSIVVISHVALNLHGTNVDAVSGATQANSTKNAAVILKDYMAGKSGSITHNGVTASYDFSVVTDRATVVCAVHGHDHKFCTETLEGGIISIGCPNVMNGRERESDDGNTYAKTAGTANGTSFCILTIDRENLLIYADCVGAGYDREFEYTTEVISYTNVLPTATDASGNIYNGIGYKPGTYLSSGADGVDVNFFATGFIPCKRGDYLYCKNVGMTTGQDRHRICFYNADKSFTGDLIKTNNANYTGFTYGADGNISRIGIVLSGNNQNTAFIRFCCSYLGPDSIITVNEPIE